MADFCDINQVWKIMTSEQYRAYLTESIKIGAQMMYYMAEDIAGRSDFISDLTVTIDFDPETGSIPKLTIKRSHFPKEDKVNRLLDIRQKQDDIKIKKEKK